jgi:hypothetical protein
VIYPNRRLVFVSVVWLALITAIFCAIWPLGSPLSKPFGSAFSPATAEVAIRGRAEQFRAKTERIANGDAQPSISATPPIHQPAIFPPAEVLPPPPLNNGHAPSFGVPADPPSSAGIQRPYPRGPPVA